MAWAGTGWKAWIGDRFTHNDPRVCEDYVRQKEEEELEAENKRLKEKIAEAEEALANGDGTQP